MTGVCVFMVLKSSLEHHIKIKIVLLQGCCFFPSRMWCAFCRLWLIVSLNLNYLQVSHPKVNKIKTFIY